MQIVTIISPCGYKWITYKGNKSDRYVKRIKTTSPDFPYPGGGRSQDSMSIDEDKPGRLKAKAEHDSLIKKGWLRLNDYKKKKNPMPTKKKKSKPKMSVATEKMIAQITQWAAMKPDYVFPAAMFSYRNSSATVSAAIRYLRKMGMIEDAGKNIVGGKMYRASPALIEARIFGKKNNPPERRPGKFMFDILQNGVVIDGYMADTEEEAMGKHIRFRDLLGIKSKYTSVDLKNKKGLWAEKVDIGVDSGRHRNPTKKSQGIKELMDHGLSKEAAEFAFNKINTMTSGDSVDYVFWLGEVLDDQGWDEDDLERAVETPIEYPAIVKKLLKSGKLSDSSYGNDVTDSVMLPHHWDMSGDVEGLPRLWIYHQRPRQREYEDSARYEVSDDEDIAYAGSDIKKALATLNKLKNREGWEAGAGPKPPKVNPRVRKGGNWSERVTKKEKYHTPPGLFTKKASTIANALMRGADGDATKAMRRLTFYMNRAGRSLTNKRELNKAKTILKRK
jgi:hypothetical protein